MSGLGLSGVFSGIDTDVLISQSMAFNSIPMTRLSRQKSQWQAKDNALADLESRLGDFKSLVDSLRSSSTLESVRATSIDSDVLAASASSGAIEGSHQVEIDQLALAHRLVHDSGLAEASSTVGVAKSTGLNLNGVSDPDATWFTTTANGASYTLDFDSEADITDVVFAVSTGYSMNQTAALINVRSQAVSGYDAASIEVDAQTGKSHLRLTALDGATEGALGQTLTSGDSIDELNDAAGWTKTTTGTGTFTYTYDSVTRSISVAQDATLTDLVALINNDAQNPGVSASLLENNSAYHLVLSGKDTGTSHSIEIDNLGTTIPGFGADSFIETQSAQDIRLRVDGYPEGDWITRNSNTVTDVIPNVTVSARAAGTTSISINRDTAQLQADLSNLTAIYNGLVDKISAYAGYNDETDSGGVLQGDSSISRLLDSLRSSVTSVVPGFLSGVDAFTISSEIGLEFGSTDSAGLSIIDDIGKLSFDTSTFDSAISSNYRGVLDLIGGSGKGVSNIDDIQFSSSSDSTEGGIYNVRVDFSASGSVSLAMIKKEGESIWRNLNVSGDKLGGEVGSPEEDLNLTVAWDGSGAYTANAEVRVRQGFGNVLYDNVSALLDSVTGVITNKREQYESAIAGVDKNIEFQQRLLDSKEMYLREKYARMEASLAKLDSQRAMFDAVFASLETIKKSDE